MLPFPKVRSKCTIPFGNAPWRLGRRGAPLAEALGFPFGTATLSLGAGPLGPCTRQPFSLGLPSCGRCLRGLPSSAPRGFSLPTRRPTWKGRLVRCAFLHTGRELVKRTGTKAPRPGAAPDHRRSAALRFRASFSTGETPLLSCRALSSSQKGLDEPQRLRGRSASALMIFLNPLQGQK